MAATVLWLVLLSLVWYLSLPKTWHKDYEKWKKEFDEKRNNKKSD